MDFQPLQDYRRKGAKALGTASTFIIREIQQKQAWIKETFVEADQQSLPFVGKFSINDDPSVVANDMIKTLGIAPGNYSTASPIREWIVKAEKQSICVSRTSFIHSRLLLDSEELQGFAIADPLAPFVFVNSEDWDSPQLFTLVHELAHIWIAKSGISNYIEPLTRETAKLHPVELFCNEVAGHALMPDELVRELPSSIYYKPENIFSTAKRFGVSSFAFLFRALSMQRISPDKYRQLKKAAENSFNAYVAEQEKIKAAKKLRKTGGPDPYLLLVLKNSSLFTKVVLDAFRGGVIQPTEASNLLNTPTNKFSKLESYLY